MKIIICGGGQIGLSIAQYLSNMYDVSLIDISPKALENVAGKLDLQIIQGHAADPDILRHAGAHEASIIVAVTSLDEVNIVTCQVAASLFKVPLKIARVRNVNYLKPEWSGVFPSSAINVMISPEAEVAHAINDHLHIPHAYEVMSLAGGILQLIVIKISFQSVFLQTPLRYLETVMPELNFRIVRIIRGKHIINPRGSDQILRDDVVYFLAKKVQVAQIMATFGYENEKNQKTLILGGGRVGLHLAEILEVTYPHETCILIERDKKRAEYLVSQLNRTLILEGDALDMTLLEEAGIESVDTVISITNDDKINILASLLAKNQGAKRSVSLVTGKNYFPLMSLLGIDKILNPSYLTISTILRQVRKEYIREVYSLGEQVGELMEVIIGEGAYAVGLSGDEINLKKEIYILALLRQETILFSFENIVLQPNDILILMVMPEGIKKIKKLFDTVPD